MTQNTNYDVFLSFKNLDENHKPTRDSQLAADLYKFLTDQGLSVFFSEASLKGGGVSSYKEVIDRALDGARTLVAIGTSLTNFESRWVRYEWDSFYNDILSGVKPNGRVFVYVDGPSPGQLPRALRQTQCIQHGPGSMDTLYRFISNADSSNEPPIGFPPQPPKVKKRSVTIPIAAAVMVIAALVVTLAIWRPWRSKNTLPQRSLSYSLTVQKSVKDPKTKKYVPQGDPIDSSGSEIYGNGWSFRLNLTPEQSGSLYLLDEGAGPDGSTVFNVLYPTPANGNGRPQLEAGKKLQTGWYVFDEFTGTERMWIIWSDQPIAELDTIFKNTDPTKLVVEDPAQIKTVRDLLTKESATKPQVDTDKAKELTTIRGTGAVIVSLLELSHKAY